MIIFLVLWNILLTACVAGMLFRQNSLQRQLNVHHIDRMRKDMVRQDNEAAG